MECCQGMSNAGKDDCIIFNKCIYHHVQAVIQYYKNAIKILKKLGFVGGNVNPLINVKKSEKIDDAIPALKENGLVLKIVEWLQDYFSCKVTFSSDKKGLGLGQPYLIEHLEKKFGD